MKNNLAEKDEMLLDLAPKLKITVRMAVKEADGTIPYDKEEPAHSFTRNFWNNLFSWLANAGGTDATFASGHMSARATGGGTNYYANAFSTLTTGIIGIVSNSNYGIVVGRSNTAFSFEHIALQDQITHGTSSGQMSHQAQTVPTPSWTVGTLTWLASHSRIFNNNSGGSISVNETGLYSHGTAFGGSNDFMIERNVLGAPVTVNVGAQLTVTYNISVVFPQ
jgi:hypothetical protein